MAAGASAERELIAAGYPRPRIRCLPGGVAAAVARVPATRDAARAAFAEAHPGAGPVRERAAGGVRGSAARGERALAPGASLVAGARELAAREAVDRGTRGPDVSRTQAQIAELGLEPWIVSPGHVDDEEDLYLAADVFVNPSLEESLPAPVLRAMAAGCPVVATEIPAHRELIEHEREGLLVSVEDPAALAAAIGRVWSAAGAGQPMGRGGAGQDRAAIPAGRDDPGPSGPV